MFTQMSEELNAQKTVERHEEEKEERYIVDLLAGSFEDLVDSLFGHVELERDANESYEYQWSRCTQTGQKTVAVHKAGDLECVQNDRDDQKEQHGAIELTPAIAQIRLIAVQKASHFDFGKHFGGEHEGDDQVDREGQVDQIGQVLVSYWSILLARKNQIEEERIGKE